MTIRIDEIIDLTIMTNTGQVVPSNEGEVVEISVVQENSTNPEGGVDVVWLTKKQLQKVVSKLIDEGFLTTL